MPLEKKPKTGVRASYARAHPCFSEYTLPDMIKILLVDDDAFNREGIRLYLQGEGMDVI